MKLWSIAFHLSILLQVKSENLFWFALHIDMCKHLYIPLFKKICVKQLELFLIYVAENIVAQSPYVLIKKL